ncbi:MAG: tRNA 2-thiocytidine biosynthesis protein TtcA [Ruminococcaceae bacterium]|nr:tRNA 2-thiocytidine biosynthesis protein TtcA [Oscillospiraceae bacterium]
MKRILSLMRAACQEYDMIEENDRIAVCVSGGKDSVVLLAAMAEMRRFYPKHYEVEALTLDPCFGGVETDYSAISTLCQELEVPYTIKRTRLGQIIFEERQETNPCSLCARMRRACLHDAAKELSCGTLALGHHNDDVVQTFMMNLFNEGRVGCFSPKTHLSRKDVTVIRPLIFAEERDIVGCRNRLNLPVVKSKCPADGNTSRADFRDMLNEMERNDRGLKNRIFGALKRSGIDGW